MLGWQEPLPTSHLRNRKPAHLSLLEGAECVPAARLQRTVSLASQRSHPGAGQCREPREPGDAGLGSKYSHVCAGVSGQVTETPTTTAASSGKEGGTGRRDGPAGLAVG